MRILVAMQAVDFRKRIDGLAAVCRRVLAEDPFSGAVFVFRSHSARAIRALVYDGQGFWMCEKRLSAGRFRYWPSADDAATTRLAAHQLQVLLCGGDHEGVRAAPPWRRVNVA